MPRQSYMISGGGGSHGGSGDERGFERPALKNSKSASTYSTTMSPRVHPKSSFSMSEAGGRLGSNSGSLGFFRSRGGELPLTNQPPPEESNHNNSSSSSNRHKMRAAVSGRESAGALPDWSRNAPSPSDSFNNNITPSPRKRTGSAHDQHSLHGSNHHPHQSSSMTMMEHGHGEYDHQYDPVEEDHYSSGSSIRRTSINELESSQSTALRQRKPMEGEYMYHYQQYSNGSSSRHNNNNSQRQQPNRANSNNSTGLKNRHRLIRLDSKTMRTLVRVNLTQILQMAIFLLVTFLLYDSHHKGNLIAARLKEFKSEEAMLFLHLHRIEQQSIQLHEALQRFDSTKSNNNNSQNAPIPPTSNENNIPNKSLARDTNNNRQPQQQGQQQQAPNIDSALIQKQTQQLMQMEEELSHEVRTLQTRIQHSAVRSIVHEYGEGPVQVIWEVLLDGVTSKVSILLWHDTPHAAWTWLEQISKKQWDGSQIHLANNRIMNVGSVYTDVSEQSRLDFIERSQQRHEAWTVGLAEPQQQHGSSTGTGGGLQVFINLQDNTEFSKHNVCIGKVFDGFDVLHKMVEKSRQMQEAAGGGQQGLAPITIRTARASHLTNRETKGLI